MFTHLLAHLVGKQPGYEAVEGGGKQCRAAGLHGEYGGDEFADGGKPAGEGDAGPGANGEDNQVFGEFDADFAQIPRLFVELHALVAVAFDEMVDPQHDFGIDRLRAGIAAPQASGHGCPPEEAERADNQQQGEVDQVAMPKERPKMKKWRLGMSNSTACRPDQLNHGMQ